MVLQLRRKGVGRKLSRVLNVFGRTRFEIGLSVNNITTIWFEVNGIRFDLKFRNGKV